MRSVGGAEVDWKAQRKAYDSKTLLRDAMAEPNLPSSRRGKNAVVFSKIEHLTGWCHCKDHKYELAYLKARGLMDRDIYPLVDEMCDQCESVCKCEGEVEEEMPEGEIPDNPENPEIPETTGSPGSPASPGPYIPPFVPFIPDIGDDSDDPAPREYPSDRDDQPPGPPYPPPPYPPVPTSPKSEIGDSGDISGEEWGNIMRKIQDFEENVLMVPGRARLRLAELAEIRLFMERNRSDAVYLWKELFESMNEYRANSGYPPLDSVEATYIGHLVFRSYSGVDSRFSIPEEFQKPPVVVPFNPGPVPDWRSIHPTEEEKELADVNKRRLPTRFELEERLSITDQFERDAFYDYMLAHAEEWQWTVATIPTYQPGIGKTPGRMVPMPMRIRTEIDIEKRYQEWRRDVWMYEGPRINPSSH